MLIDIWAWRSLRYIVVRLWACDAMEESVLPAVELLMATLRHCNAYTRVLYVTLSSSHGVHFCWACSSRHSGFWYTFAVKTIGGSCPPVSAVLVCFFTLHNLSSRDSGSWQGRLKSRHKRLMFAPRMRVWPPKEIAATHCTSGFGLYVYVYREYWDLFFFIEKSYI